MNDKVCRESLKTMQGITDLLCEIAVLSKTLTSVRGPNLTIEEKDALEHASLLTQKAAETLESCTLTLMDWAATDEEIDPLMLEEAKVLKVVIDEVSLMGVLTTAIAQKSSLGPAKNEVDEFDSFYLSLKLGRKIKKLKNIFFGLDCQKKVHNGHCEIPGSCLVAAWKVQKKEISNYA